jgi:hypothetical protein
MTGVFNAAFYVCVVHHHGVYIYLQERLGLENTKKTDYFGGKGAPSELGF